MACMLLNKFVGEDRQTAIACSRATRHPPLVCSIQSNTPNSPSIIGNGLDKRPPLEYVTIPHSLDGEYLE